MTKISSLMLNEDAIENGDWVHKIHSSWPDVSIKTLGWTSVRADGLRDEFDAMLTEEERALKPGSPAERRLTEREQAFVCNGLLQEWSGIEDFPYTAENHAKVFGEKNYRLLQRLVYSAALRVGSIKDEADKEKEKNSEDGSGSPSELAA